MKKILREVGAVFFLGVLLALSTADVRAQDIREVAPPSGGLKAADYDAHTHVRRPERGPAKRQQTARIRVQYSTNFPAEARAAFDRAAAYWETHVESPVEIWIRAQWSELREGVLGSAGATFIFADEPFLPIQGTWYNMALAEALAGQPLVSPSGGTCGGSLPAVNNGQNCPAIVANFNSAFDWSYTDSPVTNRYDFMTVVLHEIGHGLGFFDSFSYDDGEVDEEEGNRDECPGVGEGFGCWGQRPSSGSAPLPYVFDVFLEDRGGVPLLDTGRYPNPSTALGDVLQSNAVFFRSDAVLGTNEVPANLYAPGNFEVGSSIAHLDEATFPPGNPSALMTPFLARAEVYETPGPITCAIFEDLGWPLGPDCEAQKSLLVLIAQRSDMGIEVSFGASELLGVDFESIVVERSIFDGPFVAVDSIEAQPGESYSLVLESLDPARYTFRLRLLDADGETVRVSHESEIFLPEAVFVEANRSGNNVTVTFEISGGPAGAVAVIERQYFDGPFVEVERVEAETGTETAIVEESLEPGTYTYRVRMLGAGGEVIHSREADPIRIPVPDVENVLVRGPYPNPFQGQTRVDVLVRRTQAVNANLYDAMGRRVAIVASNLQIQNTERGVLHINGAELASGVYFLQVIGDDFNTSTTLVVAR